MDTIRSDKLHRRLINVEFLMVKTLHGFSFRAGARAQAREDSASASRHPIGLRLQTWLLAHFLDPGNLVVQLGRSAWARTRITSLSGDRFLNHLAAVDGGALGAAIVEVRQVEVAEAHEVKDRRVQVVDVARPLHRAKANLIG